MPRVIDQKPQQPCTLGDVVDAIARTGFDPSNDASVSDVAQWLGRLVANRSFLGDILIEQLKPSHREPSKESGYGPQAIVLSPMQGNVFLRANIWPSPSDHCFATSGAESFVYGVPHDHNFSFLTGGYLGPGYRSDYYEYDYAGVAGFAGEEVPLRFIERSALHEGKVQLYRAHLDIHSQLPPDSLSVSLNVMHIDPAQSWFDQYGFDLDSGTVTRVLSPNSTETFLRAAVATGHHDAIDLAGQFARSHPSDRLRLASYEARAMLCESAEERDALWREAECSGSRMVEAIALRKRAMLAA